MNRLKILFLNQTTQVGGAERVLIHLGKQLIGRGHHVVIGAPDDNGPLGDLANSNGIAFEQVSIPNITRTANPLKLASNFWQCIKAGRRTRQIVKKHGVQLIHINHWRAFLPLMLGKIELPIVWHVHDVFRDKWPNRPLLTAMGKRIKRAICVSKFVNDNLVSLGFCTEKCYVLHNAIQTVQVAESRSDILGRLGVPQNLKLVGSVGQIVPWKGQNILIEAATRILAANPDVCFVIVGKAFPKYEEFEKELKRTIKNRGLSDRFYFVGFQDDVLSIMSSLDILVHTSVRPDPFPTVLLEGLAVGVAIVATCVGGVPEIIEHRKNGVLVRPGDPEELAIAIIELLRNHSFLEEISQRAKCSAKKFQDVKAWVDAWETHYEECLQ